jgi:hypothetical protein
MTPNNHVCHWTGWVEVASPPEGERATLAILVWPQTLACFSRMFLYFVLCPTKKIIFLVGNEYLGVKKAQFTPYLPPATLPYIFMATSAMATNHGAVAPYKSGAGAWRRICTRQGWFPWLEHQIKMHQKIERGTRPWP